MGGSCNSSPQKSSGYPYKVSQFDILTEHKTHKANKGSICVQNLSF